MEELVKEYEYKRAEFLKGNLTERDWTRFCRYALEILMVENKDVLLRLKDE